ncbi:MAG: hypothetical protein HY899_13950 [Deltaproteobacteria bacterium]|nr:hypothetical protein [Deltaproteobacteria bacterium]
MGVTEAALADRQRQRLGMAAAVLAALATIVALATGDAKARTETRSSQTLSGGYGHALAATQPGTLAFEQRRA